LGEAVHPDDIPKLNQKFDSLWRKSHAGIYEMELRVIDKHGQIRWLDCRDQVHAFDDLLDRVQRVCRTTTETRPNAAPVSAATRSPGFEQTMEQIVDLLEDLTIAWQGGYAQVDFDELLEKVLDRLDEHEATSLPNPSTTRLRKAIEKYLDEQAG
jgi:PAS fold